MPSPRPKLGPSDAAALYFRTSGRSIHPDTLSNRARRGEIRAEFTVGRRANFEHDEIVRVAHADAQRAAR